MYPGIANVVAIDLVNKGYILNISFEIKGSQLVLVQKDNNENLRHNPIWDVWYVYSNQIQTEKIAKSHNIDCN